MKYRILLASVACVSILQATAQTTPQKAYAITAATKGSYIWTEIKQIDLATGEVTKSIYDNKQKDITVLNATTGQPISIKNAEGIVIDPSMAPFSTYAAACAFDQRHTRLYFAELFKGRLWYIDLEAATPTFHYFTTEVLSKAIAANNDESGNITRMTIAGDGNGYALTNDGNHLIRFTTGRKPVVTDLGAIKDDAANGNISFHTKVTSWGGDMVADAADNLYVISAPGYVFKVNINTLRATYLATISGIPAGYTTNGAAVVEDDKLIVSSANSTEGYFEVDMNKWTAVKVINKSGSVFNASDLANGNLAFSKTKSNTTSVFNSQIVRNDKIGIYPNPVGVNRLVKVTFNITEVGRYDVQLVDISGRTITQKSVNVGNAGQVTELPVSAKLAKGMYLVKVLNATKKTVYADQVLVAD